MRIVGHHTWALAFLLSTGIPLGVFALFEWALQIPLPKALTEEWFYPIFDVMYGTSHFWAYVLGSFLIIFAISFAIHKVAPGESE